MTVLTLALLVACGSFAAGLLGALTGLGGGIVVVPMLTLFFHVDIRYAVGASIVSVIATSSGAAAAYVREGYTNVRVGILLEVATTIGALIGAALAGVVPTSFLAILFGCVLFFTAYRSLKPVPEHQVLATPDRWAELFRLDSTYPTMQGLQPYSVQNVPGGFAIMLVAGTLSALLGIGSGIVKVLAMDQMMRLPFKVSTTTSNFMIGVTAAASAGVYLHEGYIDPAIAFPVMLGVLSGALLGARVLTRVHPRGLRQLFTVVVVVMAVQMLYKGVRGVV
ncbi:MAG TPA: sulfite exporter TauE/SafE family protein [Gemmatimonadaceae bacterium]|nr:sulfite exporter TauE/SafE family protein [Gemmatimonadaceae bacterium]